MIEVFRTNVAGEAQATLLVSRIEAQFPGYKVNFDLDDCDRILRVCASEGSVRAAEVICFVQKLGCQAEVLPDEEPVIQYLTRTGTRSNQPDRQLKRMCCGAFSCIN